MGDPGARPQADDLSESQHFAAALRFVRGRRAGRADCQVQSKRFRCLDPRGAFRGRVFKPEFSA